jgi:hypothetical protein
MCYNKYNKEREDNTMKYTVIVKYNNKRIPRGYIKKDYYQAVQFANSMRDKDVEYVRVVDELGYTMYLEVR